MKGSRTGRDRKSYPMMPPDGAPNCGPRAFYEACTAVRIDPTKRQFRKWRRHEGLAWNEGRAKEEGTTEG